MKARYHHTQTVRTYIPGAGTQAITVKHAYEHSAPMSYEARKDAYSRQRGHRPTTARQERQLSRMLDRAVHKAMSAAAERVRAKNTDAEKQNRRPADGATEQQAATTETGPTTEAQATQGRI